MPSVVPPGPRLIGHAHSQFPNAKNELNDERTVCGSASPGPTHNRVPVNFWKTTIKHLVIQPVIHSRSSQYTSQ